MTWNDHKQGIMGTIIFHLIVIIILLSFKIRQIQEIIELKIEYEQPQEMAEQVLEQERKEELDKKASEEEVEQMLKSLVSNENAENKATSGDELEDMQEYIEQTLKEVHDFKGYDLYKAQKDKNFKADSIRHAQDALKNKLDSLQSTVYLNGSSVSYKLGKRFKRYLPIPVFKCEKGGTIVVKIAVNQRGQVVEATIDGASSDPDIQLRETAQEAAGRSKFNESYNAPEIERGTITYHFVKQ